MAVLLLPACRRSDPRLTTAETYLRASPEARYELLDRDARTRVDRDRFVALATKEPEWIEGMACRVGEAAGRDAVVVCEAPADRRLASTYVYVRAPLLRPPAVVWLGDVYEEVEKARKGDRNADALGLVRKHLADAQRDPVLLAEELLARVSMHELEVDALRVERAKINIADFRAARRVVLACENLTDLDCVREILSGFPVADLELAMRVALASAQARSSDPGTALESMRSVLADDGLGAASRSRQHQAAAAFADLASAAERDPDGLVADWLLVKLSDIRDGVRRFSDRRSACSVRTVALLRAYRAAETRVSSLSGLHIEPIVIDRLEEAALFFGDPDALLRDDCAEHVTIDREKCVVSSPVEKMEFKGEPGFECWLSTGYWRALLDHVRAYEAVLHAIELGNFTGAKALVARSDFSDAAKRELVSWIEAAEARSARVADIRAELARLSAELDRMRCESDGIKRLAQMHERLEVLSEIDEVQIGDAPSWFMSCGARRLLFEKTYVEVGDEFEKRRRSMDRTTLSQLATTTLKPGALYRFDDVPVQFPEYDFHVEAFRIAIGQLDLGVKDICTGGLDHLSGYDRADPCVCVGAPHLADYYGTGPYAKPGEDNRFQHVACDSLDVTVAVPLAKAEHDTLRTSGPLSASVLVKLGDGPVSYSPYSWTHEPRTEYAWPAAALAWEIRTERGEVVARSDQYSSSTASAEPLDPARPLHGKSEPATSNCKSKLDGGTDDLAEFMEMVSGKAAIKGEPMPSAQRSQSHDLAWSTEPATIAAMGGHAVLVVAGVTHTAGDLPIRARIGDQWLKRTGCNPNFTPSPRDERLFGTYHEECYYLVPLSLLKKRGELLVDWNGAVVHQVEELPIADAVSWTGKTTEPDPEVLARFIQTEFCEAAPEAQSASSIPVPNAEAGRPTQDECRKMFRRLADLSIEQVSAMASSEAERRQVRAAIEEKFSSTLDDGLARCAAMKRKQVLCVAAAVSAADVDACESGATAK